MWCSCCLLQDLDNGQEESGQSRLAQDRRQVRRRDHPQTGQQANIQTDHSRWAVQRTH